MIRERLAIAEYNELRCDITFQTKSFLHNNNNKVCESLMRVWRQNTMHIQKRVEKQCNSSLDEKRKKKKTQKRHKKTQKRHKKTQKRHNNTKNVTQARNPKKKSHEQGPPITMKRKTNKRKMETRSW
jgi:hypothetical protein